MNRVVGFFIVFGLMFSSCMVINTNVDQELQHSTAPVNITQINPTETLTQGITATSTSEITACELVVERIVDSAISFAWTDHADRLFYSQDPELLVWREHQDQSNSTDLQSVFPVLKGQVLDVIQFQSPNYPNYSISPSGEKVVFWKNAYTKSTPTPAAGEVSLTDFEWLPDLFIITANEDTQKLVTRVEGGIIDTYWSTDERFVYMLFDQLQIPSDYFLVQVDLIEGTMKVLLPDIQEHKYDNWIALSPDDNLMAFRYREDPTTIHIMNLDSGEVDQVTNLPDFDTLFWAKDDLWIMEKNTKESATFMVFDSFSREVIDTYDFSDRVGILSGLNKPVISPSDNVLAFFGSFDPKSNLPALYTLSLCEND